MLQNSHHTVEVEVKWQRLREIFLKYDGDDSGDLDALEMTLVLKVCQKAPGLSWTAD